jgi:hypothetical protein
MTIGIAAMCEDSETIVLAADFMLGNTEFEAEFGVSKNCTSARQLVGYHVVRR